jgi:hypothetical protein
MKKYYMITRVVLGALIFICFLWLCSEQEDAKMAWWITSKIGAAASLWILQKVTLNFNQKGWI